MKSTKEAKIILNLTDSVQVVTIPYRQLKKYQSTS
ncbi:MAG: hypothetical protein ACI92I_000177 [Acidimicrobiales bacterium]|jgi:hypothetical protein